METYENEITKTAGKLLYKVKKALLGEDVAKAIGMRKRPKAVKKVVKKFEEDVTKNLWRNAKGYAKKNKKKIIAGALGTAAVGGAAAGGTAALSFLTTCAYSGLLISLVHS